MTTVGVVVGVFVTVSVVVKVDVGVLLAAGMLVAVTVAVDVLVGVRVEVALDVGVTVGVRVNVAVATDVEVAVDTPWVIITSCGGLVPSREENVTPSLLSAIKAKVYVPLPVTRVVTLYSTHVLVPNAPLLSTAPLSKAGRVFQVMPPVPDSIQLLSAR
jgi:hypothetical protein